MQAFLGVWCTVTSLAFIWPQVWRTVRHDTTHGLSPFSIVHGLAGSALWLTYGIAVGRTPVWFSNSSFIVAQAIIISVLHRHGRMPVSLIVRFAFAFLAVVSVLLPVSAVLVGWAAIATSASSLVPQVVHVAREDNLHAISLVSWAMTVVSALSWMIYGWMVSDPIMSVINYFTIPMMIYIIFRATSWRLSNGVPILARA